jgi:hypothetical protein
LGCGNQPGLDEVMSVRLHTLVNCSPTTETLSHGTVQLSALGDFPPSNESAQVLPLASTGTGLGFPPPTRAVLAHVDDGTNSFSGYAERAAASDLDLVLWPEGASCALSAARSVAYPGRSGGQALGYAASSGLVLIAGSSDAKNSDAIVGALGLYATTGRVLALGADSPGALREPRAYSTVTTFGDGFLVAGGERPVAGVDELELELHADAEVFDPAQGGFSGERLSLLNSRTHHAAITLDDGRTLLVGGRSKVTSTSIAQYQLEFVDPKTRRATLGSSVEGRIDPRLVRLSDGRILIGGGTTITGAPTEPVAEWLAPDGKPDSTRLSRQVPPRFERAFVALEAGGALAVGGCEDRPASSDEDAASCKASCRRGCPPLDRYDAWWIEPDGSVSPVSLEGITAPRPILLPGSDGSPWLVAESASLPGESALFRFNPWASRFEPVAADEGLRLPAPDDPVPLTIALDTFVWVGDDARRGELFGLRLGTRSRYAQDLALVLAADPNDSSRPLHLVPRHAPDASVAYDGVLTLRPPNGAVQIPDTDYADLTLRLELANDVPPKVLLGRAELGGSACPWPEGAQSSERSNATIVRRGSRAELRFGAQTTPCSVESGRLGLGLVAGAATTRIRRLDVTRGATALKSF